MKSPKLIRLFLILAVTALFVLHQDFWNWRKAGPLLFSFLPVGMAYHAGYTVAVSVLMWLLVRYAWPEELEREVEGEGVEER